VIPHCTRMLDSQIPNCSILSTWKFAGNASSGDPDCRKGSLAAALGISRLNLRGAVDGLVAPLAGIPESLRHASGPEGPPPGGGSREGNTDRLYPEEWKNDLQNLPSASGDTRGGRASPPGPDTSVPRPVHVVSVIEENHRVQQITGSAAAPHSPWGGSRW